MVSRGHDLDGAGAAAVESYFASPERLGDEDLRRDLAFIGNHPLMSVLLTTASGLVAVLNEHRQILSVNTAFLDAMGIHDAPAIMGLRPGEAVQCVHAHDMKAGCGTGKFCSTCGAAIAIMATLESNKPEERKCIVTVKRGNDQARTPSATAHSEADTAGVGSSNRHPRIPATRTNEKR